MKPKGRKRMELFEVAELPTCLNRGLAELEALGQGRRV